MDNTEGSLVISQVFKVRKNLILSLSDRQMSIVIGSVLGDAYIYPQGKICFEQSVKQKEYLSWKFQELENLAYPKISKVIRTDKRSGSRTISYRFFLRQYFRLLRRYFYPNRQKMIPPDIGKWLTPLAIAVWYMDDGHLDKGKYPLLATENFLRNQNNNLCFLIKEKLNITCFVNNKNRLRIRSESKEFFFNLVEPFICESMRYKLP